MPQEILTPSPLPENLIPSPPNAEIFRDACGVARAEVLTKELLQRLFRQELCAIHIRSYGDPAASARAADLLSANSEVTSWNLPGQNGPVRTDMSYCVGMPRQMIRLSREHLEKYYEIALPSIRKVRAAFHPALAPLDRLRLELEEIWPEGLNIPHYLGRKNFVGLVRLMRSEDLFEGTARDKGVCHIDDFRKGGEPGRFSANIYLHIPERGGELRIWDTAIDGRNENHPAYRLLRQNPFDTDAQEYLHQTLPEPHVIHPSPGDLVILDSARPHAVGGFPEGWRMSIQSFLTFQGFDQRLSITS